MTDNGAMPCVDDFQEVAGIWLELKIGRSGQLAFDLVPDDPDHDLDFTLFRGNDCGALEAVRCVGGGMSTDGHSGCMGATGLRADELDYFEMNGCSEWQNNYTRSIFTEAGEEYFLYVHSFQGEGGFSISFTEPLIQVSLPVQQAVQTSWDGEAHSVFLDLLEPVAQAIWTFQGSEPGYAMGMGPHRIRPRNVVLPSWKVEIVFDEDCICNLQDGEMGSELEDERLKVWPNPARDWVHIKRVNGLPLKCSEINVYSLDLTLVDSVGFDYLDESTQILLDLSPLVDGTYLIQAFPSNIWGLIVIQNSN